MHTITGPTARTILVVDDERFVRDFVAGVLEDAGHLVLTAAEGREALDLATRLGRRLHLLLTDVHMPILDGRRLAAELRARPPGRRGPDPPLPRGGSRRTGRRWPGPWRRASAPPCCP